MVNAFIKYAALLALLAGCTTVPPVNVHQPMTARPVPAAEAPGGNGAIYQAGYTNRPLFEDRRARNVGDTLIIAINEKISASKKSSSTASRKGSDSLSVPILGALSGANILKTPLSGSSENTFEGKGDSASNNAFTGTIAVTVIEVLPNGNLLVSGEKQIGINQGGEFVRFSGVVNPNTISTANTVSSTQVADARMEYKGTGYIDEAQTMGWLARFFMSVAPF
ncbi:flagellar L-ring protein [Sulfurimicrobium lacus]|uniref:Flagellar L-ring protein n=1 Tax=Sulfurimicrobium lacus TaxID=2715678 RepID=A0A6F8VD77_9PROT|nr:flagellar basal body L-ring protein FlgH [Sulfurimicrobium lacus]BCB26715.1 flagellar L-ring protein [Sulfurimicrobium lacus]